MKGLRSILGESVKQAGGPRRADEQACLEAWGTVVGEGIAEATRAERLRDGILFVAVRTSVWAYELTFHKEKIARSLNDRLGRPLIRDIRFKVGPLVSPVQPESAEMSVREEAAPRLSPEPAVVEEALTERSKAQVESAIAAITDERIRERTRQVLMREALKREQRQKQGWKECRRCGTLHPETHKLCPLCRLQIKT